MNKLIQINKLIQPTADKVIEEIGEYIDEHIGNTIHWQLDLGEFTSSEFDDIYELELKIKQQVLSTLIERVTNKLAKHIISL